MLDHSSPNVPADLPRHTRAAGFFPNSARVILPAPGHAYAAEQVAAGNPMYADLAPWPHDLIEWGSARVIAHWTPTGHSHREPIGANR